MELAGLRIVLGVTGGIAAYKSPDLVRRLRERGAEVQVVMTAGARAFVTPLTFQAVSGRSVRESLWDEGAEAAMGHIEIARWADAVLVAPATADFLARLAQGRADDLLTTVCLTTEAPLLVAPAMNRLMWSNPATQANRDLLEARSVAVLGPGEGDQACGEMGAGRMLEPVAIADALQAHLAGKGALSGKHVVVTAGPTREPVDPVRYLSNRSSGRMGHAVASAARAAGARVTLVTGPTALDGPTGVRRVDIETAEEMLEAVQAAVADADVFIGAAAVADYRPAAVSRTKIKRSQGTDSLGLEPTPDVLAWVVSREPAPFTVGFAAETEDLDRHARHKLESKGVDLIVGNLVGEGRGFDVDDNHLIVYWRESQKESKEDLGADDKESLARRLVGLIARRMAAGSS